MTTGWKLDRALRDDLLQRFPPRYARAVADHVTLLPPARDGAGKPPATVQRARIVGRADDEAGVEAMVVELDGTLDRPDGGTWHVTWSLAPGREAKESNDVIARLGFTPMDGPDLSLVPARW